MRFYAFKIFIFGLNIVIFKFLRYSIYALSQSTYIESRSEVRKTMVSYKKLWKLLIDKNMKKKDLRVATGISTTTLAKLSKDENVSTEILAKICKALQCDVGDIMEMVND